MGDTIRISPWITHERIDDEVVAINFETGAYFAMDGVAADVWAVLAVGATSEQLVDTIVVRYEVNATRARADLERLLDDFRKERLAVWSAGNGAPNSMDLPTPDVQRPYDPPSYESYDDLDDLLLLDPIHEVDESGWPVAHGD